MKRFDMKIPSKSTPFPGVLLGSFPVMAWKISKHELFFKKKIAREMIILFITTFTQLVGLVCSKQRVNRLYNIARVHSNLILIGVFMVHFSTYAGPCVCARYVIKKLFTER